MSAPIVRFGLYALQNGIDYPTLRAFYLNAEQLGYDSVWLCDHVFPDLPLWRDTPKEDRTTPMLEAWTALSALAVQTSRIRVGVLVLNNAFRHPPLVAKMVATLDVITGGRLEFGIGTGWYEGEHRAYGYDFPNAATRVRRMSEAVEILKLMWTQPAPTFRGEHYQVVDAVCEPKPIQKPHPPISIGGTGERYILRAVAQHANIWNCSQLGPEGVKAKTIVLEEHCAVVGRDPNAIEKSWRGHIIVGDQGKTREVLGRLSLLLHATPEEISKSWIAGTAQQCVERLHEYVAAGITHFILDTGRISDREAPVVFAEEVMPHFRT